MKKLILHLLLLITSTVAAFGQTPCFKAVRTKGCVPFKVDVRDCSGQIPARRFYKFMPGDVGSNDSSYTYIQPGIYTITQIIGVGAGTDSTKITVEAVAPNTHFGYDLDVCAGNQVTLTVTSNVDTQFVYNFGDPGKPGNMFWTKPFVPVTYNYTPGDETPKYIQIGPLNLSACVFSNDTTITPITALVPADLRKVEVLSQDPASGSVAITFIGQQGQRYFVQQSVNGTGAYSNIDTLSNISGMMTVVYYDLNTASNQYCFRLLSYDDCNPPLPSREICSIINTVTANNGQNDISWTSHLAGNVVQYDVNKNNTTLIASTAGNSATDNAVNCGVNYCYSVTGQLTGGLETVSASQCVVAKSANTPPAVSNVASIVSGNAIVVTWDKPLASIKKYNLYRSQNGSTSALFANPTGNNFTDANVGIPGNTYCYEIEYIDSCDNKSPGSVTTCPILLEASVDPVNYTQNNLSWSPYSGSWSPTSYIIEKLDENNNIISSFIVGATYAKTDIVSISSTQVIRYRIKAVSASGDFSYSNIEEIKYEGAVFLPNAFTPNGDNNNDSFVAKGKFIKDFNLKIYNRWGEVVYATEDMNEGWNGFYLNGIAPSDAYAYLVEATDLWGKKITKRGSVTLLR